MAYHSENQNVKPINWNQIQHFYSYIGIIDTIKYLR